MWARVYKEIEKRTVFDHEDVIDSTSTGRPVCRSESTKSCVLTQEHDTDFRVCSCERRRTSPSSRACGKDKKNHPHREALQADLQQNNVYNPFSRKSKEMIRELGNLELFELCGTKPKVQCSHCLLYWNQGIVYCTCGQCLLDSESRRKSNKLRLDALSIPNYVMKKGRNHVARHGKTKEQTEYHMAWNAWKRCCKKSTLPR